MGIGIGLVGPLRGFDGFDCGYVFGLEGRKEGGREDIVFCFGLCFSLLGSVQFGRIVELWVYAGTEVLTKKSWRC